MSEHDEQEQPELPAATSGTPAGDQGVTSAFDWNHPATWPMLRTVFFVLIGGAVVVGGGYALITRLSQSLTVVQRVTTAFAVATAIGALVALVVNLRKQDVSETTERRLADGETREIAAAFTDRFRNAAEQLGRPNAPERIAGVYAMAALADEYPARAQQCVDVLCGYLRLPYDPQRDGLVALATTYTASDRSTVETAATPAFDGIVRTTITDAIRARTTPVDGADRGPWSELDFNLVRAHLVEANLSGARFHGDASFDGAHFHGDASFDEAHFHGDASFDGSHLYGDAEFNSAHFHGKSEFGKTHFHGNAQFNSAHFHEVAWFSEAHFHGDASFGKAHFLSSAWFGKTHFHDDAWLREAYFHDDAWFSGTLFYKVAVFYKARVAKFMRFDDCSEIPGSFVDMANVQLVGPDARILKNLKPFRGWDLRTKPESEEPEA